MYHEEIEKPGIFWSIRKSMYNFETPSPPRCCQWFSEVWSIQWQNHGQYNQRSFLQLVFCCSSSGCFINDTHTVSITNPKLLETGSKVYCLPRCFPLCPSKPAFNINAFICHVSTVSSWSYTWSFLNDTESCRTRKNNEIVRQEV